MNIFFWQLSRNICEDQCFELDNINTTFENLVKFLIFLKSSVSFTWGSCLVIQGWFDISSSVILFSGTTSILDMRSFTSLDKFFASGTKSNDRYCQMYIAIF